MELATPREADKRNKAIKQIRYLSEKMACYMRNVIVSLGLYDSEKDKEDAIFTTESEDKIEITPMEYGLKIVCPFRLPSKNTYRVNEFWWGSIEAAIRVFSQGQLQKYDKAVLVYMDVYPFDCKKSKFTDADNQDIKRVTDCIKECFLTGDDSLSLWILQMGRQKDVKSPYTEIHLVEQCKIANWMMEQDFL